MKPLLGMLPNFRFKCTHDLLSKLTAPLPIAQRKAVVFKLGQEAAVFRDARHNRPKEQETSKSHHVVND